MNLKHLTVIAAVAIGCAACEIDEPVEEHHATAVQAGRGAGDLGAYDTGIGLFMGDYVRGHELLLDDDLAYDVKDGVVRVTGAVDTAEELTTLRDRIRRVPAVREVDLSSVRVGP